MGRAQHIGLSPRKTATPFIFCAKVGVWIWVCRCLTGQRQGAMFWLNRNMLVGSYFALIDDNRA